MDEMHSALAELKQLNKDGGLSIHNKKYSTVPMRIEIFRKHFGTKYSIENEILVDDGKRIVVRSVIKDTAGNVLASGHAEEFRGTTNINKTSALENAETSAAGRCLGMFGLHGGEMASAFEVEVAIDTQQDMTDFVIAAHGAITACKSQVQLAAWFDKSTSQMDALEQRDPDEWTKIVEKYEEKEMELNNGNA